MNLKDLKKQIPFRWKVQSYNSTKTKGSCVAYIDARDVMDLLDEVIGQENWKDEYIFIGNQWLCGISIYFEDKGWVTKWDTGVSGNTEIEKSVVSDSFKRASVKWGVGRFLYSQETKWIDVKNKKPVDKQGNIIWDLTKHFNQPLLMITDTQERKINELVVSRGRTISEICKIGKIKSIDELTEVKAEKLIKALIKLPEATLQ